MAWVDGKWVPENDSVADNLTGLLDSNSTYIKQARAAGTRTAASRGLMNSSIAAGTSESAAIAAALPIASQDASATATKNNIGLEGEVSLSNQTKLNDQTAASQKGLQAQSDAAALIRQKSAEGAQLSLQEKSDLAAWDRQAAALSSSERQTLLQSDTTLAAANISAASQLKGDYLQSISNLTSNSKLKAADRNAYIAEFQRVTSQGAAYEQTAVAAAATFSW